jgi:hypothetical protein
MMPDEMTFDWFALLQRLDDATHGEAPPGFNRQEAEQSFAEFVKELSSRMDEPLQSETGVHVQDASFYGQVIFGTGAALRFSAFGRMVAFTPDMELPENVLLHVKQLVGEQGYTLVPTEILETDYTGPHPGVDGIDSWWIRYFDWL